MAKARTRSGNGAKLTASITRESVDVDELETGYNESFSLEVGRLGPKEIKKALADSEIITRMLREHPKEMTAIVNDSLEGKTDAAREAAVRIGLTEEAFQRQGGGLFWWLVIAFVGGAILAAAATTKK
jgi:hypothetical protein